MSQSKQIPENSTASTQAKDQDHPRDRELHKEDRRQRKQTIALRHIANTAWQMFEQDGFSKVTMESIADAADVAKATLYKYFPSKEALLDFQLREEMADQKDKIQIEIMQLPSLRARLDYLFKIEAEYLEKRKMYMTPLLQYRMQKLDVTQASNKKSLFYQALTVLLQQAQQSQELRADLSVESLANYLNFLRSADLFQWLAQPNCQLQDLHQRMLDLFFQGAAANNIGVAKT